MKLKHLFACAPIDLTGIDLTLAATRSYSWWEMANNEPVLTILSLVLRQAIRDRAQVLHMFLDEVDDFIRIQEYCPVLASRSPADPNAWTPWSYWYGSSDQCVQSGRPLGDDAFETKAQSLETDWQTVHTEGGAKFYWIEMMPLPASLARPLLADVVRRHSRGHRASRERIMELLDNSRRMAATVVLASSLDVRIYFGDSRPAIRIKPGRSGP